MKTNKAKTFDCVAMKNRIQEQLMEEYESRKDEFASYAEFIVATADRSALVRSWWARIGGPHRDRSSQ